MPVSDRSSALPSPQVSGGIYENDDEVFNGLRSANGVVSQVSFVNEFVSDPKHLTDSPKGIFFLAMPFGSGLTPAGDVDVNNPSWAHAPC